MLAILARSGQYLPRCLTFGPHNGPEDFGFATDRVYAPGRGRKMRLCKEWQIYADDITVRSGRVIEGVIYTDEEHAARKSAAREKATEAHRVRATQDLAEAFKALGFSSSGLSEEDKTVQPRKKTKGDKAAKGLGRAASSDPSPYAHGISCLLYTSPSPRD